MISFEKVYELIAWSQKKKKTEDKRILTVAASSTRERFRKKAFFFISIPLAFIMVVGSVDRAWAARTGKSKKGVVQGMSGRLVYDVRPALSPVPWRDPFSAETGFDPRRVADGDVGDGHGIQKEEEMKGHRGQGHKSRKAIEEASNGRYGDYSSSVHRQRSGLQAGETPKAEESAVTPQVLGHMYGEFGAVVLIKVDRDTVVLRPGQRYRELAVLSVGTSSVTLFYRGKVYDLTL